MIPELEQTLAKKYPYLFVDMYDNPINTAFCFGIECDDGWYEIIDKLCNDIVTHCQNFDYEMPKIVQIKEKFGGLRFYIETYADGISQLIDNAESLSYKTCEVCGNSGEFYSNHRRWLKTLCVEHAHELDYIKE